MKDEITAKQVLIEFETLLKDTGLYLFSVGARIVRAVKKAVKKSEKDDSSDGATADGATALQTAA
ncbi:MAG: hypothetical protein J1G38_05300 [Clostridiales bacterium]|nr:hypothetical protein [Clostridiales bacterium]